MHEPPAEASTRPRPSPSRLPHARRRARVRAGGARHPPGAGPRLHRLSHGERGDGRRRGPREEAGPAARGVRGLPPAPWRARHRRYRSRRSTPSRARFWRFASGPGPAPARYVRAASGEMLVNVFANADGGTSLVRKRTGERRVGKPAKPVCVEGEGHARLSCGSCHTAWAPRCPTCHTSFDAQRRGVRLGGRRQRARRVEGTVRAVRGGTSDARGPTRRSASGPASGRRRHVRARDDPDDREAGRRRPTRCHRVPAALRADRAAHHEDPGAVVPVVPQRSGRDRVRPRRPAVRTPAGERARTLAVLAGLRHVSRRTTSRRTRGFRSWGRGTRRLGACAATRRHGVDAGRRPAVLSRGAAAHPHRGRLPDVSRGRLAGDAGFREEVRGRAGSQTSRLLATDLGVTTCGGTSLRCPRLVRSGPLRRLWHGGGLLCPDEAAEEPAIDEWGDRVHVEAVPRQELPGVVHLVDARRFDRHVLEAGALRAARRSRTRRGPRTGTRPTVPRFAGSPRESRRAPRRRRPRSGRPASARGTPRPAPCPCRPRG